MENKKFCIVVAGYKCEQWAEKSLLSAAGQQYDNFRVIVTNDASPDSTGNILTETIIKNNLTNVKLINSCDDQEITIMLDLDDWLAHPNVLTNLNEIYKNENIWATYGSYLDWPGMTKGCCKPPPFVLNGTNNYRHMPWFMSHLRTMYSGLFKKIKEDDFKYSDGSWYSMAWDLSIMLPVSELCAGRLTLNLDNNLLYNNTNPISDHRVNQNLQAAMDRHIRSKRPYQKLDKLF